MSTIGSLELFEKFAAKFPDHQNKVEQMRSTEYHANTIHEYYEWLKLSIEYLGMDSIKAWEREELLEMSK